jgi:uncharacterized Zn finger protein (UPF0148 family)
MRARPFAQGELVLNCPGCGTKVADGTSICPKCDYIIDASFLSSEPPSGNTDDESTAAAQDPRKAASVSRTGRSRTGTTGKVRAVPTTGKSGSRAAIAPGKPSGRTGPRPAIRPEPPSRAPEPEPQEELPSRKPVLPPASDNRAFSTGTQIVAPEQMIEDAREFISDLTRSDKIALAGASTVILSCFLPWKETAMDGDVLGLMSAGIGALFLALLIIGTLVIRVRRSMPKLHPLIPWMTQLIGSVVCVLYTLILLRLSVDSTEVPSTIGNQMIMNSSPSLGVFIGLLGGLGAVAGSLMGLKERPA